MTTVPDAQLTHVGLYVDDMDAMVAFYTTLLGLVVSDRGELNGRELVFLTRQADEHHQLVFVTGRRAERDVQLLSQISFRIDGLDALRHFHRHALDLGALGMEPRNHGNSWSIYFLDPEGNRVEVYTSTPWYVSQPWRVALDLGLTNEQIEAETLRLVTATGTWAPVEAWRAAQLEKLAEGPAGGHA